MPTSSFSTSNVFDTVTMAAFEGASAAAAVADPTWEDTFDWTEGIASAMKLAPYTGVGDFSTWNGLDAITAESPAAMDAQTMTYVAYAARVRLGILQLQELPGYREGTFRKIGFSAASTIAEAAASAKADAFTANLVHGTKTFFATDHETQGGGTRGNVASTGFDRTAYLVARAALKKWVNFQNQILDLTGAGLILEYHPDSHEQVRQAVMSIVTSDQGQLNVASLDNVRFVENAHLDSPTDVIVHCNVPEQRGFKAWERMPLVIFPDRGESDVQEQYTAVMAYGFRAKATPDGAYGIKAAA